MSGAISALQTRGIAGISARTIASEAGVNQALVFYHFESVTDLIGQACRHNTATRVAEYAPLFAEVDSLRSLLAVGRILHEKEREVGNVTVLAQVLAGAQQDEQLATIAAEALALWTAELGVVIDRVISASVLAGLVDVAPLTEALTASFIGIELYEAASPISAAALFDALEPLAIIANMVDELGAVPRKAVRARLQRAIKKERKVR